MKIDMIFKINATKLVENTEKHSWVNLIIIVTLVNNPVVCLSPFYLNGNLSADGFFV